MPDRRTPKKKAKPLSPRALELVAQRFRTLGVPLRLQILQELIGGELNVQEICERTGATQSNVSKHLATLTDQGILSRRKEGLFVYHEIADPTVFELCELVCGSLAQRFEEVRAELERSS